MGVCEFVQCIPPVHVLRQWCCYRASIQWCVAATGAAAVISKEVHLKRSMLGALHLLCKPPPLQSFPDSNLFLFAHPNKRRHPRTRTVSITIHRCCHQLSSKSKPQVYAMSPRQISHECWPSKPLSELFGVRALMHSCSTCTHGEHKETDDIVHLLQIPGPCHQSTAQCTRAQYSLQAQTSTSKPPHTSCPVCSSCACRAPCRASCSCTLAAALEAECTGRGCEPGWEVPPLLPCGPLDWVWLVGCGGGAPVCVCVCVNAVSCTP